MTVSTGSTRYSISCGNSAGCNQKSCAKGGAKAKQACPEGLSRRLEACFHSCNKRSVVDPSPHLVAGVATKRALVSPPIEGWPITLARRQPLVRWFVTLGGRSQTQAYTPECKGSSDLSPNNKLIGGLAALFPEQSRGHETGMSLR